MGGGAGKGMKSEAGLETEQLTHSELQDPLLSLSTCPKITAATLVTVLSPNSICKLDAPPQKLNTNTESFETGEAPHRYLVIFR